MYKRQGLCFVQLSAGDGTKIQGMISKKEIGADSLKQFKQLVDLGDHLYLKGRVIASKTGELSVFATEWAIASKALQPLPALHKDLNEDTRTRKPYIGMIADEKIRNMVRNRSKAVASPVSYTHLCCGGICLGIGVVIVGLGCMGRRTGGLHPLAWCAAFMAVVMTFCTSRCV